MTTDAPSRAERFLSQLPPASSDRSLLDDLPVLERDNLATTDADFDVASVNLSVLGLVELILKRRDALDRLIRDPSLQPLLLPRLLAISLIGFLFFGVAMSLVLTSSHAWPELTAIADRLRGTTDSFVRFRPSPTLAEHWLDGSALRLTGAYAFGLIAATGVCLPSLYFYGLLAGVRMNLLDVAVQALRSKATSAVALVGILPIYAAVSMGIVIFEAPEPLRLGAYWLGLILPFIAGLWGTASLYHSFSGLCDTLPLERRWDRTCFLRRLVASWAVCYTAVSPVMIYTLWERLAR
jgi:hypothetical protein